MTSETLDLVSRIVGYRVISDRGHWFWNSWHNLDRPVLSFKGRPYHVARLVSYLSLGLDLDDEKQLACHKCDDESCWNPSHLYVGTHKSNSNDAGILGTGRMGQTNTYKTHCPQGHEYTKENTYILRKYGERRCRTCIRSRRHKHYLKYNA